VSDTSRTKLLRGLASSWLGLAISIVISFFMAPFIVNKLGAAWYGVWAVAAQFTGFLFLLDFGVRESVIRYTSKYAARNHGPQLNRVLSTAVLLYGGITTLALVATGILVWGMPHWFDLESQYWRDARIAMAFTGATIAVTFLFNVYTGIIMGLRQWELVNAVGIGLNLLRTLLVVVFLWRGHGIVALTAIQFAITTLGGIIQALMSRNMLRNRGLPFHIEWLAPRRFRAVAKKLFGYGFYVIVNNVGEKLIGMTSAIIVGSFLPIATVAYYAIASTLVGHQRQLFSATATLFNPLASHLHALGQRKAVNDAFMFGMKINIIIGLPVSAVFVVLGQHFIALWMGEEFAAPAAQVLTILAITAVLSAPQIVISSVLYGLSRHRIIAVLRIIEGVINLGLSIVLVQRIGLSGVALGTAIPSIIIVMFVLPVLSRRAIGIDLTRFYVEGYLRPLLAIVPMALLAWWVRVSFPAPNLWIFFGEVALLCLVYLPCAFILILNANERLQIVQRLRLPTFLAWGTRA
jgi:O-antigen/teichoic acid export membrane protein